MPVFEFTTELSCQPEPLFDFLTRPVNATKVTPPEFRPELLEAPDVLVLGSRFRIRIRRLGVPYTIGGIVTALEPVTLLRDEQTDGPFRKWVHTHRLEVSSTGTRMLDQIEYEPPGGLLGLVVKKSRVDKELKQMFEYRAMRFRELFTATG